MDVSEFHRIRAGTNNKIINSLGYYADMHFYFCGGGFYEVCEFTREAMHE